MKNLVVLVIIIIIGTILIVWLLPENGQLGNRVDTPMDNWQQITNEDYDFTLSIPESWQYASTSELFPAFNAHTVGQGDQARLPITHHSSITNVSIFPEGIPTEGLFASSTVINFSAPFAYDQQSSRMFVLEDGTPFAAYIRPANMPTSWGQAGFVWLRVEPDNLETRCVDTTGTEIPEERCDPLTEDHEIIWSGEVDQEQWNTALQVLGTMELGEI